MIAIFHEKDLDGICSGAIMKYKYPNIKLIGYDNGDIFDINSIDDNEEVIMSDISVPMDLMKEISIKTNGKFTWIGHHISTINNFNNFEFYKLYPNSIKTIFSQTKSACELTWETLFPNVTTPYAVELLSAYDVWDKKRFDWDIWTLPFQYGMRLDCNIDINKFNQNIFKYTLKYTKYENLFQVIYNSGVNIMNYQNNLNKIHAESQYFEENVLGYRAICINDNQHSSTVFDSVYNTEKHDIMLLFYYAKNMWTFSVYTTKDNIDCSIIAKHFLGGGHKKTSGFKVDRLEKVFNYKSF